MKYFEVPKNEQWRLEFLGELFDGSSESNYSQNNEASETLQILCTT